MVEFTLPSLRLAVDKPVQFTVFPATLSVLTIEEKIIGTFIEEPECFNWDYGCFILLALVFILKNVYFEGVYFSNHKKEDI